ncbi:PCBP3 [Cordylochernes scorpioides]|uniref:PCBP3 n=1 Tax=Cordylochernes scorpioides TaxID=51811 RepID=A0ABY6K1H5_9ARAC|nr:PCBP3 [Cordylochernes scorpioides]
MQRKSGARINISDGTSTERLVTVTGSTEAVLKAFALIASKFEEVRPTAGDPAPPALSGAKPPVTLRLVVPDSQCGSLIGKGGAKIKEIREVTGASVQVASEMLPNSTERTVTISGSAEAISKCIYQICCVMLESPPKGPTIPYRPKPSMPPVIFAGGQAYTVQGSYAIPHPDLTKLHQLALQHSPLVAPQSEAAAGVCLAAAASPLQHVVTTTTTTEMTIPNDLIGSVIGKGGTKINEIRQLSRANIKISNSEEGSKDRVVTITGSPEAINIAQYLINSRRPAAASGGLCSMEVCKPTTTTLLDPTAVPLSQLVPLPSSSRHLTTKLRTTPSSSSSSTAKKSSAAAATDRNNKFSPY